MMRSLRTLGRIVRVSAAWRAGHARLLLTPLVDRQRNVVAGWTDRDHLEGAAAWLAQAQDAMADGGVGGRFLLRLGWTSSYPETTGYLIPTFLALEAEAGLSGFADRAGRAVEFLLDVQLPDGAFPAGEIAENRTNPSVFNTAQIITGLEAWHRATGDERALAAARRAADWMVAMQDRDGAWRQHVYHGQTATYHAHAACWLAQLGAYLGEERYLASARRHLDWVLQHVDRQTGWIDLCGFSERQQTDRVASTHTIAYTLWGVLHTAELVGSASGCEAAERAAWSIARKLELRGWIPGMLDHAWRGQADYACLTGNAQLALLWFRLYGRSGDARYVNAGLRAIDLVKLAHPLGDLPAHLHGAVPGSDPIWGGYIWLGLPNWAAKFFADALLEKERIMRALPAARPVTRWTPPPDIPRAVPAAEREPASEVRTVLYAGRGSGKVEQMVRGWSDWGFRPVAVVIERTATSRMRQRLWRAVRERGVRSILAGVRGRFRGRGPAPPGAGGGGAGSLPDPVAFCRREGIPVLEVDSLDSEGGVAAVRELRPDLAIHAGAGILRDRILGIPRLGTLNAHMGLLPKYRGMNVAEWAALADEPVGCTVHFIDPGIDTGPIAAVREVDTAGIATISGLREAVDREQIALLGEVARFVSVTGRRPPTRPQSPDEGRQYFRMHPELRPILEAILTETSRAGNEARVVVPATGP